jgi:hypothetical protein
MSIRVQSEESGMASIGFVKAYRLIEFSNIGSLNEWFDENRDIEVVKLEIREIHSIIRYYLLYKKII